MPETPDVGTLTALVRRLLVLRFMLLHRFPYTSIALAFALLALAVGLVANIDIFELSRVAIPGIEPSEVGEIVTAFLLVIPAVFVDHIVARQRAHEAQFVAEQLRVLRVTVRAVQNVVNNNLNQLQLLRVEAEGHVPHDTLTRFDATIHDTTAQLTALGNMTAFADKPMGVGSGLDILYKR
jgi:hypothetical protein